MSKKFKIAIIATFIVMIAMTAIGVTVAVLWQPKGYDAEKFVINSYLDDNLRMEIHAPMRVGRYFNTFYSELNLQEICDKQSESVDGNYTYRYEILGDDAIIYMVRDNKIVSHCQIFYKGRVDITNKNEYSVRNGSPYILNCNGYSIDAVTPYYMAKSIKTLTHYYIIELKDNVYFNDVIKFYQLWYNIKINDNPSYITIAKEFGDDIYITYKSDTNSLEISCRDSL